MEYYTIGQFSKLVGKSIQTLRSKGYSFDTITDKGSGINYNKKGLIQLINMITDYAVDRIVILYKDRLIRFGYELIENLCSKYGTEIEVIDQTEKTEEQELVEDIIQIVTVFSCRLQGKRANKAKKLIKELLENDNGKKSQTVADARARTTTPENSGNSAICI